MRLIGIQIHFLNSWSLSQITVSVLGMEANQSIEGAVSPSPNYVSDGIVPVSAVFLTLSTFFLALRVYTRVRLLNAFYSEDCEVEISCYRGCLAYFA